MALVVAENEEGVVGLAVLLTRPASPFAGAVPRKVIELDNLVVHADQRNRKIGRRLLAATVERLPLRRRPRIVSLNYPGPGAACGIDQRAEEIGRTAINILASLLTRGERGIPESAHSTLVEGRWHAGQTVSGRNLQPRQPRA